MGVINKHKCYPIPVHKNCLASHALPRLKATSFLSCAFLCLPMVDSPGDSWQEGMKIPVTKRLHGFILLCLAQLLVKLPKLLSSLLGPMATHSLNIMDQTILASCS